jgi:hypothetical protein
MEPWQHEYDKHNAYRIRRAHRLRFSQNHPREMKKPYALVRCLGLAALSGLAPASGLAQTGAPAPAIAPEAQAVLKQVQGLRGPTGGAATGWTCVDPEDGKRMHVMDTMGNARMNSIPSSAAGLQDTTTPIQDLPRCKRPD